MQRKGGLVRLCSAHPDLRGREVARYSSTDITGTWTSGGYRRFRYEGFDNREIITERASAKGLNVKLDRRSDVRQGFFIGVALTHNNPIDPERIGHTAVGMLFHNDLEFRSVSLSSRASLPAVHYPLPRRRHEHQNHAERADDGSAGRQVDLQREVNTQS